MIKDITIQVIYEDELSVIQTYKDEYRNLMMLIYDKIYTEEFGECKGVGRCGTCLVEILESTTDISTYERNEEITIARTGLTGNNLRLSCQILIDHQINNLKVKVVR
jgi:2Fe-2S ferredoxin